MMRRTDRRKSTKKSRNGESGVSETIGSVLLIGLVVTAVAIVGVAMFSQPPPQKIPALNAIISTFGNTIKITHNGGDTLQRGEMMILVDGQDQTDDFLKAGDPSWQTFSSGDSLTLTYPNPGSVRLVFTGAGATSVLSSAVFGEVNPPTCTFTITASAGSGGTISPSGTISACYGDCWPFTITPDTGYHIVDVVVDGGSVGPVSNYTVCLPSPQDRTISASFAVDPPTFTSITPNSGTPLGGTPVTIVGGNFVDGDLFGVTIGGVPATTVVWVDASHITAVTPAGTGGAQDVVVSNYDGQTATGTGAYTYFGSPSIISVTPPTGSTAGGTAVSINGTNLFGATAVTFGGTNATPFTVVSATTITTTTPAHASGAVNVVVTTPNGTATGTYTYLSPPTFTSITPNSGTPLGGTPVTIVGTNFVSGGSFGVTIGGAPATSVVWVDASHITAVTPAGTAGARNVTITNNDGQTVTGTGAYTYFGSPTFVSIAPLTGSIFGGDPVTITGTNLTGATAVTIGGTAATGLSVVSSTSITAITPSHAAPGAVNVVITTPNGTATGTNAFTYVIPSPTFTSISPTFRLDNRQHLRNHRWYEPDRSNHGNHWRHCDRSFRCQCYDDHSDHDQPCSRYR